MTTRHFAAALVFGVILIAAVCLAPARGTTSRGYQAYPASVFSPLPLPPLGTPQSTTQSPVAVSVVTPAPTARPRPSPIRAYRYFGRSAAGVASWFCNPPVSGCTAGYPASGMYAAAGPRLRVGNWRGRFVEVSIGGHHVRVQLIDWCACGNHLLDLYSSVLVRLGLSLQRGIYLTEVSW